MEANLKLSELEVGDQFTVKGPFYGKGVGKVLERHEDDLGRWTKIGIAKEEEDGSKRSD